MKSVRYLLTVHLLLTVFVVQCMEEQTSESLKKTIVEALSTKITEALHSDQSISIKNMVIQSLQTLGDQNISMESVTTELEKSRILQRTLALDQAKAYSYALCDDYESAPSALEILRDYALKEAIKCSRRAFAIQKAKQTQTALQIRQARQKLRRIQKESAQESAVHTANTHTSKTIGTIEMVPMPEPQTAVTTPAPDFSSPWRPRIYGGSTPNLESIIKNLQANCMDDDEVGQEQAIMVVGSSSFNDKPSDNKQSIDETIENLIESLTLEVQKNQDQNKKE